jgi:hypothetical protein
MPCRHTLQEKGHVLLLNKNTVNSKKESKRKCSYCSHTRERREKRAGKYESQGAWGVAVLLLVGKI